MWRDSAQGTGWDTPGRRGEASPRPYIVITDNPQDAMDVVGHDDEFVQLHVGTDDGCPLPFLLGDLPKPFILEQALAVVGAEGDEVCPWAGVVPPPQPDGTPMVFLRVVAHLRPPMAFKV